MDQRRVSSHEFLQASVDEATAAWARFQEERLEDRYHPEAVHFIPARGGCFVVLQDQGRPSKLSPLPWVTTGGDSKGLLEEFGHWLDANGSASSPGSVMVVDDDRAILRMLSMALETSGYEVYAFADAQMALNTLTSSSSPDVMAVDLRMPGMDGRQFIEEVRARQLNSKILIVSAFEATPARRELQADASIQKPLLPDEFVDLVESLTNQSRQDRLSSRSNYVPVWTAEPNAVGGQWS